MRHADDGTLNAWLDGALAPDEAAAVAVHLEHCDACRSRLTEVTGWRVGATSLLASAAPGDVNIPPFERVLERAAARQSAGPQPIVHHRPGALLQPLPAFSTLAWAATIVLALLIGWYGRELVLRQGTAPGEGGGLAVRTGAPGATPAAAAAPEARRLAAPAVVPPEVPPPAPGRVAATREADHAGQGVSGGVVAEAAAQPRDSGARAEPAATPTLTGAMAENAPAVAVRGAAAESARTIAGYETGKLAAAERAPAVAVRAAAPKPLAVAAPDSLRAGRADAALRESAVSLAQGRAAAEPAAAKAFNAGGVAAAPTFTPYTVAPRLRNREDVRRALDTFYPAIQKASGLGGTTTVWLFLDTQGSVLNTLVKQSSGQMGFDSAALRVARVMRFTPALYRDQPVSVWVTEPIVFQPAHP